MQTTSTVHFVVPRGGIRPNIKPRTNLQSLPLSSLPEPLRQQATPGEKPGTVYHLHVMDPLCPCLGACVYTGPTPPCHALQITCCTFQRLHLIDTVL